MGVSASQLIALVEVQGAPQAVRGLLGVGAASDDAGAKLRNLTIAGVAIAGAALVALGAASLKSAADFQTAMLSNVAHAGLAKSQIDNVSQSVLAMSTDLGRAPTELAEALYPILSAFSGIQDQSAKSSIALQTLRDSFETVAGTTVDGTAVANAAVGTFNALGLATNNVSTNTARMNSLFDVMDKTVQLGNMQWETYKNVVSKMAIAIQGTGISFNESQAALAELTNEGFTAQKASTYLANTFATLEIKTDSLAQHAKSLGIAFDEQKFKSLDLAGQIEYLNQVTDGNKSKLLALMGNNRTALQTFDALSIGIGGYKNNLDALNHAQGTLAGSFAEMSQGFNFQIDRLKAAGQTILITIGTQLLPVATHLAQAITPIVVAFNGWITSGHAVADVTGFIAQHAQVMVPLLAGAGALIGGLLVAAFVSLAISAGSAAVAVIAATWPFLLIGAAVAGVAAIFVHFYQTSAPLRTVIQQIGEAFQTVFEPIKQVATAVHPLLDTFDRASGVIHTVSNALTPLTDTFDHASGVIKSTTHATAPLVDAFDRASSVMKTTATGAHGVTQAVNPFIAIFKQVASVVQGAISVFEWVAGAVHTTIDIFNQLRPTLAAIGSFLASNFTPVWKQLVDLWQQQLVPLGKQIWAAIQPLMPLFIGLAEIVGVVLVVALGLVVGVIAAIIKGLAGFLSGLVIVIGGIVQVITGVIQVIAGIIRVIIDIVTLNFGDLGPALGQIWQGIINIFAGAWTIIAGLFLTAWFTISGIVVGFVQGIIGFFTGLYNDIVGHSIIPDMINGIINWFAQLPGRIWAFVLSLINYVKTGFLIMWNAAVTIVTQLVNSVIQWFSSLPGRVWAFVLNLINYVRVGFTIMWNAAVTIVTQLVNSVVQWFSSLPGRAISAVQSLQSKLAGFFGGLASQALTWGKNIIQGIIDGINNMLGAVGNAAQHVASTIANFLPHSPAKEGPLSKLNEFGPALVKGFSQGIIESTPMLRAAVTHMVQPLAVATVSPQYRLAPVAAASSGNQSFSIPIYIGTDEVAEYMVDPVMGKATRKTRLRHGRRAY